MSQNHGSDKKAAMTGLVVTAALLFLMALTIVTLTNASYAGEKGTQAEATK